MRTLLVSRTPRRQPGRLYREILVVARFLADLEAIRGWGAPLPPPVDEVRSTTGRVA